MLVTTHRAIVIMVSAKKIMGTVRMNLLLTTNLVASLITPIMNLILVRLMSSVSRHLKARNQKIMAAISKIGY